MLWRGPPLRRGDVAAFLVAIAALAFVYVAVTHKGLNWGFGPEWRCAIYGNHEPVCVKDQPKP